MVSCGSSPPWLRGLQIGCGHGGVDWSITPHRLRPKSRTRNPTIPAVWIFSSGYFSRSSPSPGSLRGTSGWRLCLCCWAYSYTGRGGNHLHAKTSLQGVGVRLCATLPAMPDGGRIKRRRPGNPGSALTVRCESRPPHGCGDRGLAMDG